MGNEILEKTSKEVFYTIERWEAFLELMNKRGNLEDYWYKKFAEFVVKKTDLKEKWTCNFNSSCHLFWCLKNSQFNDETLSFWVERKSLNNDFELILWASRKHYDLLRLNNLVINDEKFQPLRNIFNTNVNEVIEQEYILRKKLVFKNSTNIIAPENVIWYMGLEPEIIYNNLLVEIDKITNEENTKLFEELQSSCIRQ